MSPEAQERQRHLDSFLQSKSDWAWVRRAIVLDECGSTQDEAFAAAAGQPGLVLTALRQARGRGRLGRSWNQRGDLGLAATIVLDANAHDSTMLPLRAACAVCDACEHITGDKPDGDSIPRFRIKWPNDVVVSNEVHDRHTPTRKLAGILIERRDALLLLGVGINVLQQSTDWPEGLRESAGSLAQLTQDAPRHDWLLRRLLQSLDRFLFADRREIRQDFRARDVLTGTRRMFQTDQTRYSGIVESIDPADGIRLKLDSGESIQLPASTSTLVH